MELSIKSIESIANNVAIAVLVNKIEETSKFLTEKNDVERFEKLFNSGNELISFNKNGNLLLFLVLKEQKSEAHKSESLRKKGFDILQLLKAEQLFEVQICNATVEKEEVLLPIIEGLILSNYSFDKYKSKPKTFALKSATILSNNLEYSKLDSLQNVAEGVFKARDLVNEPVISLNAVQLSEAFEKMGKEAGFDVEVFHKSKIQSLKMGGLLAINAGSIDPPTFTVMEYKPDNASNSKPIVLVGKGVVYDTGGLSLKDTTNSMDLMKSDMAGSAAVAGAMYAIAKNKLPIHVIGLVPATDNRPDGNAITPGDVITIMDGTTVEILNTDAEGRVILADALAYSQKYEPELVIDLATLTGAAIMAIGKYGSVMCATATKETKELLVETGFEVNERLVELPLWDEYTKEIESDIADIKNLGGSNGGGAITAAKFLEHFTTYPWIHLDIAGPSFNRGAADSYRGKNGTGVGVRLIYSFLEKLVKKGK